MNFTHVPAADTNCTTRNNSVLFSVKPTNTSQYIARAFFPSTADRGRNILVNAVSISHYPQCNGGSSDLEFSSKDANGVRRSPAAERRLALSSTAVVVPRPRLHRVDVPTRDDITEAARRIDRLVRRTPVVEFDGVTLKLEMLQHAGSFKPRGAFNTVLAQSSRPDRLVAASGGNHGLAVAHVGATLGIPTDIFVPDIASPVKVAAIRGRGATVHQAGADYAAALVASESMAASDGVLAIHAYDAPLTLAGQGTVARELSEQAPDLDVVVVAVGGAGLIGGIAAWYAGTGTRVVAVEPELCPSLHHALEAGRPIASPVGGSAADALGATSVGQLGFAAARDVRAVLVGEEDIAAARRILWRELRLAVEPAGATAYAAVQTGAVDVTGQRVGVVVCGANTDPSDLAVLDSERPPAAP